MGEPTQSADARPRGASSLLHDLHGKFTTNFQEGSRRLDLAANIDVEARRLWQLGSLTGNCATSDHQRQLGQYFDEIFGDSTCALYLAYCGMQIPARVLLRRCLELGIVIAAYWDAPAQFWGWKDHDEDVRFSAIFAHLQSDGHKAVCRRAGGDAEKLTDLGKKIEMLYHELSNVVHPKPLEFATKVSDAYSFKEDELRETLQFAARVQETLFGLHCARFGETNRGDSP